MRTTHSGKTHEQAWCVECGWSNGSYKNALATAARHADSTGHEVHIEQGISIVYNQKGEHPAGSLPIGGTQ